MNGPKNVKNLRTLPNKESCKKAEIPSVQKMSEKIDKVIEPTGSMDASHVPEGTIEK